MVGRGFTRRFDNNINSLQMSYAAAGFMVVLVVHDLRARGPGKHLRARWLAGRLAGGKRPLSSRVNWQAGWRQTTSELAGQLAGRLVANDLRQTTSELTGPLAGRLAANDLRARGPTGRPAGGKRPLSSRANWQAGWRQTTSELASQLAGRLVANDL